MKKILIAVFGSIADSKGNALDKMLTKLEGLKLQGGIVATCVLPTERFEAIKTLICAIEEEQPYFVITLEENNTIKVITTEMRAKNTDIFSLLDRIPDHEIHKKIEEDGPDEYLTKLPVHAMQKCLKEKGIESKISETSLNSLCNHVSYGIHHFLRDTDIVYGYIHIPFISGRNHWFNYNNTMFFALTLILKTMIKNKENIIVHGDLNEMINIEF